MIWGQEGRVWLLKNSKISPYCKCERGDNADLFTTQSSLLWLFYSKWDVPVILQILGPYTPPCSPVGVGMPLMKWQLLQTLDQNKVQNKGVLSSLEAISHALLRGLVMERVRWLSRSSALLHLVHFIVQWANSNSTFFDHYWKWKMKILKRAVSQDNVSGWLSSLFRVVRTIRRLRGRGYKIPKLRKIKDFSSQYPKQTFRNICRVTCLQTGQMMACSLWFFCSIMQNGVASSPDKNLYEQINFTLLTQVCNTWELWAVCHTHLLNRKDTPCRKHMETQVVSRQWGLK